MKESFKYLISKPEPLFLLGYMVLPFFALVCAGMGLWMIIDGHKIAGLIMILFPTQVFAFGSLWAVGRRKRALLEEEAEAEENPAA